MPCPASLRRVRLPGRSCRWWPPQSAPISCSADPAAVAKAERKGRTKAEVDQIICWLTGYDEAGLSQQIEQRTDFETFFARAPAMHPNRSLIKGVVCGIRVEEVDDPLMQKIRQLDKLVDELAKGKAMAKILR